MDKVRFTLYEITGYLLPGAICTFGIFTIFCIANNDRTYIPTSIPFISIYLLMFYTLGHACQSIANIITDGIENKVIQARKYDLQAISQKNNISKTNPIEQFRIISSRSIDINLRERSETYLEREGYYRGTTVAHIVATLAITASLFFGDLIIDTSEMILTATMTHKIMLLIGDITLIILYALRYYRFLKYRINLSVDVNM